MRQELSKAVSPVIKRSLKRFRAPWPKWYAPPIMLKGHTKVNAHELVSAACLHSQITLLELKSEMRHKEYARPRNAVAYVLKRYRPDMSNTQIAKLLGRTDPTTIISAVNSAEKLRNKSIEFANLITHLESIANGTR